MSDLDELSEVFRSAFEYLGWVNGGFLLLIALGAAIRLLSQVHSSKQTLANLGIAAGNYLLEKLGLGLVFLGGLYAVSTWVPWSIPVSALSWVASLLLADFTYYWMHRCEHRVRALWTYHAVHHSSPEYNLSTSVRLSWIEGLFEWVFFLPMTLLGFEVLQTLVAILSVVTYQTWIHTQSIGRLGWLDAMLNTPSNHRVHHGANDRYIDKNFGGVLILWDRFFGTYQAEEEPVVFGVVPQFHANNPFLINFWELSLLLRDMRASKSLGDALGFAFRKPGWRPMASQSKKGGETAVDKSPLRLGQILFLILSSGCSPDSPPAPVESKAPTYFGEIRPLLTEYCVSCHTEGSMAPFALTHFEQAKKWATPSAHAVASRQMPPFLANDSGDCGHFENSGWLTEPQIELFEAWAAAGAPEGETAVPAPVPRRLPSLGENKRAFTTGVDYLPDQQKSDDYRCFVLDSPGEFDIVGFDVLPGNPRITHHLIAYQVANDEAAEEARALDEKSEEPGYPCFGTGPQVDVRTIAGWAPGAGATIFPEGTGVPLAEERPLILEMHYNIAGGPGETDQTTVELEVAEAGTLTPLIELGVLDYDFRGPLDQETYSTTESWPGSWSLEEAGYPGYKGKLLIHGANGHMHARGMSMRMDVSGEANACLLDIPRWDFDWQLSYWFKQPIEVSSEDFLSISCTWNTKGLSSPLMWGDGTSDEMCLGGLFVTLAE